MFLEAESPAKINLFIFMPLNEKLLPFRKKGDTLTLDDLMNQRAGGATQMVMPEADYDAAMLVLSQAVTNELNPDEELSKYAQTTARVIIGAIGDPKADHAQRNEALDSAADLARFMLATVRGQPKSRYYETILKELKNNDVYATHNRHVGAFAAMLMMAVGGYRQQDLNDLTFAGFFHDLFLKEIPAIYSDKHLNGEDLTLAALKAPAVNYYRHVELVLKKFEFEQIAPSAAAMRTIVQHHENFDGSGLKGSRGEVIYGPARILRIADDTICLMNRAVNPLSLQDAFEVLCELNRGGGRLIYDPELLAQLDPVFSPPVEAAVVLA